MRILFIRHGDPDYENDTLTEKGRREAALLAQMAPSMKIDDCYMSPLGRAQATASCSLKAMGKTAAVLDWLKEFPAKADLSLFEELADAYGHGPEENSLYGIRNVVWDMLPSYWTRHPEYSDVDRWQQSAAAKSGDAVHVYKHVCREFDRLLETYGYQREDRHYRVVRENTKTIACYCHYGIICAILSHLWNVSPFVLWQGIALAPTSVTEVVSEERQQGTAVFRALRVGDISHLYAGQEPPSLSARFFEVFSDMSQRH